VDWLRGVTISARFRIGELLDLAASGTPDVDDHVKTIFAWYEARAASTVRGLVRSAAAIGVAFLAAALSDNADIETWHIAVGTGAASFLVMLAGWTNWHLGHIQREFVVSIRLLRRFQELRTALDAYNRSSEGA
jgi:hypothetical protein